MHRNRLSRRLFALATAACLVAGIPGPSMQTFADGALVLTLGADLTEEQKQGILDFFNVKESDTMVITVTNADERKLLEGQYTEAQIGTKTFSCALVNPTASGGIQVKTANMNVVTSGRIASILSTSGITDCEVLTAAPFMVSGTGALTGVMMGYEEALGVTLDPEKQQMAIEESTTVSQIGETMGQNEATLVVNDIKIRVVRDQAKEPEEIRNAVNTTVDQVEEQLAQLAQATGSAAPEKLDTEDREVLYDYGDKLSKMNYDYNSMKLTLQRVTVNAAREIGIDDPITETFEDLSAEDVLPENSILLGTNDESMGEDANITATDTSSLEDAPSLDKAAATAELRGNLYALFDMSMTWTEARKFCRALKGDLVSITTLEEQEFVKQLAAKSSKDYSWLGGERSSQEDRWWWSSGEGLKFTNWDDNQPDGADNGEYFMRMANRDITYSDWTAHAGKWNDANENGDAAIPLEDYGFICEIKQERGQADDVKAEDSNTMDPNVHITDVRLTHVSSIENGEAVCNGTSLAIVSTEQGEGLATFDGTVITDQWYYNVSSYSAKGLIEVQADREDMNSLGVVAQNGNLVVPCTYAHVKFISPHWVLGINVTDGSAGDHDYKSSGSDGDRYYAISNVDVYFINDGEGTKVGSLGRDDYAYAQAQEDYINIENRSGVRTTFDSSFQVVANDVRYGFDHIFTQEYSDYYDYESTPSYGIQDANGNIVLAPFADYIYSISGGCVYYGIKNGEDYLYGLKQLDGTDVLPAVFDRISDVSYSSNSPVDMDNQPVQYWNHGGYYLVVYNGTYGFAQYGGEITCDTGIDKTDIYDSQVDDVCIATNNGDETPTLYAADGKITNIDGSYSYLYGMDYSMGMLWRGFNGTSYDVFDWHGNKLLSELASNVRLSEDGMYLVSKEGYDKPLDVYAVTYVYDNGQEISPQAVSAAESDEADQETSAKENEFDEEDTTAMEDKPAEDETAITENEAVESENITTESEPAEVESDIPNSELISEAGGENAKDDMESIITVLENTVTTIQNTDFEANRNAIAEILDMEVELLESENAEAATILESVAEIVRSGSGDAITTVLLVQSAIDKLKD